MNADRQHSSQTAPGSGRPIPKSDGVPNQRKRSSRLRGLELLHKAAAKVRDDHRCQRPGCTVRGVGRVESAHLKNKQMGGDHGLRTRRQLLVTACPADHQALHAGLLKVVPQTDAGADGPLDWYQRETLDDEFFYFGTSRPVGSPR